VVNEVNGAWDDAIEVPGTAALNTGGLAQVGQVSCASAGDCAAGGWYSDSSGASHAFVADEVNGTWDDAIEVPGTAALDAGGSAQITSVSCPSAGVCAAVGGYFSASGSFGTFQTFAADEVNGTWRDAIEVPGTAALNAGGSDLLVSVSCPSAGNCSAGGGYTDSSAHSQTFVVSEVNGTWANAIEVPLTANTAGLSTGVTAVSCPSSGNCAAVGDYSASSASGASRLAFVVSQVNGTWGEAIQVPGTPAASISSFAEINSVSCPPAGGCAAGGADHDPSSGGNQAFVVNQN
jgi:hypothetical protein